MTAVLAYALTLAACGGASTAPRTTPSEPPDAASSPLAATDVLSADSFGGRTFVVLEVIEEDEAVGDELDDEPDEERPPLVLPRPDGDTPWTRFTLYGPDGACAGTNPRPVMLEAYGIQFRGEDDLEHAHRVRFAALEVDAECLAWLAIPGPSRADVRFDSLHLREPTDEEIDEEIADLSGLERGRFGTSADAVFRVGPIPEDDVCPEFVTYEIIPDDGTPPTTVEVYVETILGVLRLGDRSFFLASLYHQHLMPFEAPRDGMIDLRVPSQTGFDIEASPCL